MDMKKCVMTIALLGFLGIASVATAKDHGRIGGKFASSASHSRSAHRQNRHQDRHSNRGHRYRRGHDHSYGHRTNPYRPRYKHGAWSYPGYRHGWAYPAYRRHVYRPYRGGYSGYGTGISVWIDGLGFTWYEHGY